MNAGTTYRDRRNNRTVRYAGRVLDVTRTVAITANAEFLQSVGGQVAAIVAANLLARMTPAVVLAFPNHPMHRSFLGRRGNTLHESCLQEMTGADPYAKFETRSIRAGDYQFHLGGHGAAWVAHGADWNAYVGPSPSPLPPARTENIFGSAFAAVTAVAKLFAGPFPYAVPSTVANVFHWQPKIAETQPYLVRGQQLGNIWFAGAGSVGSAVAYFLALAGYEFGATVFDGDVVKIENLDRSPIFTFAHDGLPKTHAVAEHLRRFNIEAHSEPRWLDESELWQRRQSGTPDVLVSAANERNVRYLIETQYPPVQIYGTTGKNWQATVLRHVPLVDPCSCCIFPAASFPTKCATGSMGVATPTGENQVDASLPFLSFAAGLMAAAEISKLSLEPRADSNRSFFTPLAENCVLTRRSQRDDACICRNRSSKVHLQMMEGGKYASLSRL